MWKSCGKTVINFHTLTLHNFQKTCISDLEEESDLEEWNCNSIKTIIIIIIGTLQFALFVKLHPILIENFN